MRHTISILVENKFGVLARIAGMFSGRGFNIDTLNVGPTLDATASRMTIVVRGDDKVLEQVTKQLEKLVDVIDVQDFRDEEYVDRELVLLRVTADVEDARRSHADLRYFPRQDHRRAARNPRHRSNRHRRQDDQVSHADGPLRHQGTHAHRQGRAARAQKIRRFARLSHSLCPPKSTPTKTPTSQFSKARPSPCSASARRATPTR